MLYSDHPRVHYDKAQLAEVICQFRFPVILSIGAREPVDFQEAVRSLLPRYAVKEDRPAPKITRPPRQAGAAQACCQPQLHLRRRAVEAESDQLLHLPEHHGLSRLGELRQAL